MKRSESIRLALLRGLVCSSDSPVDRVALSFGVSRQAVHRILRQLVLHGAVLQVGSRRHVQYRLTTLRSVEQTYEIVPGFSEDRVWKELIEPQTSDLPAEDRDICAYAVTEMVNNAIDHAAATKVEVSLLRTAAHVRLQIRDDGVGILARIRETYGIADPHQALLELSKGKLTTDPKRHTGEGLFFTSRMVDQFNLLTGRFSFRRVDEQGEVTQLPDEVAGTAVECILINPTSRNMSELFMEFSSGPDDYRFARTVVPIHLASFGDELLISRSSAKRVLSRVDRFDSVVLDYAQVRRIGQAFADEIYRVFQVEHPNLRISSVNANADIERMISRAKSAARQT